MAFPFHFSSSLNFKEIDTCFCATFINPIPVISTDRTAMGRKRRRANGSEVSQHSSSLNSVTVTKTRQKLGVFPSSSLHPSVGQQAETN